MADADEELSEGSDIEVDEPNTDEELDEMESDLDSDDDENTVPDRHDFGNLRGLFDSDDSDDEFMGFQADWVTDPARFQRRNTPVCNLVGGAAFQHPENFSAGDWFDLLWSDEVHIREVFNYIVW